MKFLLLTFIVAISPGLAFAQAADTNDMGRPGGTANSGTMGSGTTASTPSDRAADMQKQERAQHDVQRAGDPARGPQSPADATVNSGVDRTTTTATTGMPIPFASLDVNGDGNIDKTEAEPLRLTGHQFDSADEDRNQSLSGSEYQRMIGSRTP